MAYFDETDYPSGPVMADPDNDRFRLGRELARDFQSNSFSSSSHGSGRHNNDDSGTLDSFDISNDAQGMSTRKIDMLQQTPTINTQLLNQFPDFSMAGNDITEDSMEVGRGANRNNNNKAGLDDSLRSIDFSSHHPFSIGGSTRKSGGKLFSNVPAERKNSSGSAHSDELRGSIQTAGNKGKEVEARTGAASNGQRLGSMINFDLSQLDVSTPQNNRRTKTSGVKVGDFVSSSSGGSQSRFPGIQRTLERDAEGSGSDAGSIKRRGGFGNARFGGSPKPRQTKATTKEKGVARIPETNGNDLTDDLPAMIAKSRKQPAAKIPQNFKSTDAFLHELGLEGNTTSTDVKSKLQQLKNYNPGKRDNITAGITQQSFMLPEMSDLSELISGYPGDATRMSMKRGPFGNTKDHRAIDSIPIPHDERAILMAMRLLQEKVAKLEESKAEAEHRCMRLETELRRSETRTQMERQKSRAVGENLERKRSGDSAFGGSDDGDSQERMREKAKLELQMEKLKLESAVNSLHTQLDRSTRDLETAKIALKHMQEERNHAVNSVAMAIANNEDLKNTILELQTEIQRLRQEILEQSKLLGLEREEWKEREDRLRRKAKVAKEAAMNAEDVMNEAAKRDAITAAAAEKAEREAAKAGRKEQRAREKEAEREAEREQERLAMESHARRQKEADDKREQERVVEQQKKLDNLIKQQLRELRPDIPFEALRVNQALVESNRLLGKERPFTLPKRSKNVTIDKAEDRGVLGGVSVERDVEKGKNLEKMIAVDDTVMSISPEDIRRIAKNINEERRKRKAAAANANTAILEVIATEDARSKEQKRPKSRTSTKKPILIKVSHQTESGEPSEPGKAPKLVRIERFSKGKEVEKPMVSPIISPHPEPSKVPLSDPVSQAKAQIPAKKTRLIKKVVYYYDEDLTMNVPVEEEVEEEYEDEGVLAEEIAKQNMEENESTSEFEEGLIKNPLAPPPIPAKIPLDAPETPAEDVTILPERVQKVVNRLAAHDPDQCTVCHRENKLRTKEEEQRNANPLADIDNSMAIPAPVLELASKKKAAIKAHDGYEEEPTPRPSQAPRRQLSKVVRQLQDEFSHLKLNYQEKADEFMNLDPTIGKKRRKMLTNEMNELVADMDYKCDQIYALYDVNEEFVRGSDYDEEEDLRVGNDDERESDRGRAETDDEDEYDMTGFTIPEMSAIEDSSEASDDEEEGARR
ncbi:uncharacterized protein LAJ45_11595 [Morchella importuna]|uniref:uncharacterized protein n=1 Tax=Morchella importuna TaxID=1174673 RepID=UPI001E8D7671|nr:uncharacterized protein LAJ45_11595 [Morchella importuna]KAH8144427.1 hypothetical protein LAJ45_11595 [Morchella importuna]